jgi:hypothetical protein
MATVSGRFLRRAAGPALALMVALTSGAALAATGRAAPGWRVVQVIGTPTAQERPGFLTASSASDAFTSWQCVSCSVANRAQNFVLHWDGHHWRPIALPAPLNYSRFLIAMGASSVSNLWVITSYGNAGIWNGASWTVRSMPSWALVRGRSGDFTAVLSVFSRRNVWVFSGQPAAAHLFKGRWHRVRLPVTPYWISPVTANDIWALGFRPTGAPTEALMRWNGSAWRTTALPAVRIPRGGSVSYGIAAAGPRALWMTRTVWNARLVPSVSLLHWTGTWHQVPVPFPDSYPGALAPDGNGGAWFIVSQVVRHKLVTRFYHYGRGRWSRYAIPTKPGRRSFVASVTWIPGTRSLWAIGSLAPPELGAIMKFGR